MKIAGFLCGFFLLMNGIAQKTLSKPANTLPVKLKDAADTMQYTLGVFVAQWMNSNGFLISNTSLFLRGVDDILQNRPRTIPDSTVGSRITAYQKTIQRSRVVQQELQLFNSLKDKPGVGTLPNGVKYIILKTGKGAHPSEKDTLVINMIARLADGTLVEDTYQAKKPFITTLAGLFPGLNDPMQLMVEGSIWQLFIPAVLAYGDRGTTLIPPNSALIIEAELIEIRPPRK